VVEPLVSVDPDWGVRAVASSGGEDSWESEVMELLREPMRAMGSA
jgi:hypothetical protein